MRSGQNEMEPHLRFLSLTKIQTLHLYLVSNTWLTGISIQSRLKLSCMLDARWVWCGEEKETKISFLSRRKNH